MKNRIARKKSPQRIVKTGKNISLNSVCRPGVSFINCLAKNAPGPYILNQILSHKSPVSDPSRKRKSWSSQKFNRETRVVRILTRYVVREHIGPFFLTLLTINSFFVLNLLYKQFEKFLSKGIPLLVVTEFLFLNLAWMIALSVPMAVLPATIMAFGRLAAENETTAARASGIGLHRLLPPLLLLSAVLAGGLIWFNNEVLPDFNHRARLLATDIARKRPMIDLEPGVIYDGIPDYSILAKKVREAASRSAVEEIIISDHSQSHFIKTITARSGDLWVNPRSGLLEITLYNGELQEVNIEEPEALRRVEFPKQILRIPMDQVLLHRRQSGHRGDREKSAAALMESVNQNRERVQERENKLSEAIRQVVLKYTQPGKEAPFNLKTAIQEHKRLQRQVQSELSMIASYQKSININLVEVHKKYAIPAACVVFLLIGAPLGLLVKKRGWAVAILLSLGFWIVYWAFLIGGEFLADRRIVSPFLAMWGANLVVGIAGIYLSLRVICEVAILPLAAFRTRPKTCLESDN